MDKVNTAPFSLHIMKVFRHIAVRFNEAYHALSPYYGSVSDVSRIKSTRGFGELFLEQAKTGSDVDERLRMWVCILVRVGGFGDMLLSVCIFRRFSKVYKIK